MQRRILDKIESLPPLPKTIVEIKEVLEEEEVDLNKLAEIIERDPFIKVDLIKQANSPFYGLRSKVDNVKRIVNLFGIKHMRMFILENILKRNAKEYFEGYDLTAGQFMNYVHDKQYLFEEWNKTEFSMLDIKHYVSSIIFIEDIGKTVIDDILIEEGLAEEMQKRIKNGESVSKIEKDLVGTTSHWVSYEILRKWKFPPEIWEPIHEYDLVEKNATNSLILFTEIIRVVNKTLTLYGDINEKAAITELKKFKFSEENFRKALKNFLDLEFEEE